MFWASPLCDFVAQVFQGTAWLLLRLFIKLRSDGTALKDASFWSFIFAASSLALQGRSFLCVGLLFMGPPFSGTVLGCPLCSKDSTVPFNEQKRKRNLCSHHKIFSGSIGRHSTDHAFFSCLLILLAAN